MLLSFKRRLENSILQWINVDRCLPIQLDITNACNLRCKHCYHPHHKNEGAIGLDSWIKILDQYDAMVQRLGFRPYVILCGGEPTLSSHYEPILENLSRRAVPYRVSVLTNGTRLDSRTIAPLKKFKDAFVQVSLDGPDRISHDRVRGVGSFERALCGIRLLKESGIPVHLLAILSRRTLSSVGEFFTLAGTLGVSAMGFTRLIVEGAATQLVSDQQDRPLAPPELRDAYQTIIKESARTGVRTDTNAPLFHLAHPGLGRNGRFAESITIDYQGRYLASSRSRLALGNALNDGIESIFLNHSLLQQLRKKKVKGCGSCPDYAICGGDRNAAYAASGDFLGKDPGCWKNLNQIENEKEKTKCVS